MPYCCLSSSSVRCLVEGGGAATASQRFEVGFTMNLRRFLFHTCIGSGPAAPFLPPVLNDFAALSRRPLVDFATSRGRDPCCSEEVEELAEEDSTGAIQ